MPKKATPRWKLFAHEYCKEMNGTKAAISVGYSEKSATMQASRLLTKEKVKSEVERILSDRAKKLDITAEKVLGELAKMAFANMQDYIQIQDGEAYVDLSAMTREQAAAIQEITSERYVEGKGDDAREVKRTKFKLSDKRGSLELLGKHLKLFTDKSEITGLDELANLLSKARNRVQQPVNA